MDPHPQSIGYDETDAETYEQEPKHSESVVAAEQLRSHTVVPAVPMPRDADEEVAAGRTPHPSGLNRAQRRAAVKAHKAQGRARRGL